MGERRILYLSRNYEKPAGGVRVAHHHVRMLCNNGFDAMLLLSRNPGKQFFASEAPSFVLDSAFKVEDTDTVVIPEAWDGYLQRLAKIGCQKVIFCQNHFYIPYGLGGARDYSEYGVRRVFCCSDVISLYLKRVLHTDAPVVHNGIDLSLFTPGAKKRQIAFMPRKMPQEAMFIRQTFRRLYPRWERTPWIAIQNVSESEVARILRESEIFLSLARLEGLGLPPIEAMASGAAVVGFHGDGGREYATSKNGLWVQPEDWLACAGRLDEALTLAADRPQVFAEHVRAGAETANRYTLERMERELLAFWTEQLARSV
jgi:glycosyltransferase involved in cell wall biosynthesis